MKQLFLCSLVLSQSLITFSQNTWQQKASIPGVARFGAVAFVINDKAYVGTGEDDAGNLLKDFWRYDFSSDSWLRVADFPGSARRYAAAFSANGKGYVGTGFDGNRLSDFYSYDAVMDTWTAIPDIGNGAALGRYGSVSFAVNDKGYVATGFDGTGLLSKETWMYSDSDATWYREDNFDTIYYHPNSDTIKIARRWAAGFTIGSNGFACAGYEYSHYFKTDTWRYSQAQNKWIQADSFPGPSRAAAISFVIGSQGYVGAGYNFSYLNDFYTYDAIANSWRQIADCSCGGTSEAVGFSLNGKGYLCSGRNSLNSKNELWEYTPDTLSGIVENKISGTFNIYPNPAHETFTVSLNEVLETRNRELKIIDVTGRVLHDQTLNRNQETVNCKLNSGFYFVKVSVGEKEFTLKLVIE